MNYEDYCKDIIVLDYGHICTKIGFATEEYREENIKPNGEYTSYGHKFGSDYIFRKYSTSSDDHNKSENLKIYRDSELCFPFSGLEIQDYDLFIKGLEFGASKYCDEKVDDLKNFRILLCSLPPIYPTKMKSRLTEIFMEYFGFKNFLLSDTNTCMTYSAGTTSGLSLSVGAGMTSLYCIHEGYDVHKFSFQTPFGGTEISTNIYDEIIRKRDQDDHQCFDHLFPQIDHLQKFHSFKSKSEEDEGEEEEKLFESFTLPDDSKIRLTEEEIESCNEVIFSGDSTGVFRGLETIVPSQLDKITELMEVNDFVVGGGVTLMKGFVTRLDRILEEYSERGLKSLGEESVPEALRKPLKKNIVAPRYRGRSCWIGGSILASLETAQRLFLSYEDVMERSDDLLRGKF